MKYSLTIGWLYPNLMNVYGDKGNITAFLKRANWRNIETKLLKLDPGFKTSELKKCDFLLMGGAQDRQQIIVNQDLERIKIILKSKITKGIPGLFVCGGFQFLGKYYKESNGSTVKGLGIFDLYTQSPRNQSKRLIGNMAFKTNFEGNDYTIIGFENHNGRTYLGENIEPFGTIIEGSGNNGKDKTEGARFKNSFGTYSHGPILPKNPDFTDYLIGKALEVKYGKRINLKTLNNALEQRARFTIANRIGIRI